MATCGVTRDRSWLNLKKRVQKKPVLGPSRGYLNMAQCEEMRSTATRSRDPLIAPKNPVLSGPSRGTLTAAQPKMPIRPDSLNSGACTEQYAKLISLIDQLSSTDDGILMNRKFKMINETWASDCPTSKDVENSFNCIYQKCLQDEVFAAKVVAMIATNTYSKLEISERKIRLLFIGHLQRTYEDIKMLQETNPRSFRIGVRMLSEYYSKGRLANGRRIAVLAPPLLCYLDMLLESGQPADKKLFASQLYINGPVLQDQHPREFDDIAKKAKIVFDGYL